MLICSHSIRRLTLIPGRIVYLQTTAAKIARADPDPFAEYAGKIELIVITHHPADGGNRLLGGLQQQLGADHPLIFAPAQNIDTHLLTEQMRQPRRRQADMARHFVDAQLTGQITGNKLACLYHPGIHDFLWAERIFFHRAQQQALQQVHPQLFGETPAGTLRLLDIGEQPIELQQ